MQEKNRDFSFLKQNILKYLDFKGISKYEFYQKTGVSNGVLSQTSGLSEDGILKFISYYTDVNPEWLLTGKGEMIKSDRPALIETQDIIKGIPLITYDAVAGFSNMDNEGAAEEDFVRYIVPEFINKGVEFLIRVSGSSMYPKYSNGDILACRFIKDRLFFQWGKIYVIDSSQGILVKRVRKHEKYPEYIILESDNREKYQPFDFPTSDIRSLSIVVGVIRLE
ncbi:MAG: helix-turn-helix transcriptional regulator [Bacteroidales bacterium]|nr:helix-turn-helix transcriptional regulator [Bacteroidales bacterium]